MLNKKNAPGKKMSGVFYLMINGFSLLVFFLVWYIVSVKIKSPLIIPTPKSVFLSILELVQKNQFWQAFFLTFFRVVSAFLLSSALGFIIGCIAGINKVFNAVISFPMSVIRSTPVAALILIAVFWVGSESVPVFTGILMALPVVVTSVVKGFENTDKKLLEMAEIFDFSSIQVFVYLNLPSIFKNIKSALLSTFSMVWKVVVAGEILALPKHSIGNLLYTSQIHLETSSVWAYTIIIVLSSWILEKVLDFVLKKDN